MKGEAIEQARLFSLCRFVKELKWLFAVPNGGSRNLFEARNLKLQGVKPGVPDMFLPIPNKKYHGLFIELKHGKNKPTKYQLEWIDYLNKAGYLAVICYGHEAAFKAIKNYIDERY